MADPKPKSLELPIYLNRILPLWQTPQWLEAERWRRVVRQQPVAIICRDTLITYLQALPWEVRARKPREADALADEIEAYIRILDGVGDDFDSILDRLWQDALDLPVGGTLEVVRWPDGMGPFSRPHPKGHVAQIVNVDGATLYMTYDRDFPMAQRIKENAAQTVYFQRNELARIVLSPRPELERKGYGMAPPERIYLALTLLYRGDTYYANLLLDTPEAGVLDLLDMSQESANDWIKSARELLQGIDPLKIPILYEHDKPAIWIPFGRPPTDMLFDTTTLKYARVVTAGYWLSLSDVGLEPAGAGGTLAGQIRDERRARRTGFGVVKEKTVNLVNGEILPPYLEFTFVEKDEEALNQRYRAFVLAAQAMKIAADAGVMSARERQEQLKKDGLITVEVEAPQPPPAPPPLPILPPGAGLPGSAGGANAELQRVPESQGGRGEFQQQALPMVGQAELGTRVGDVPAGSPAFDQLAGVLRTAFGAVRARMGEAQLRKLVKKATRLLFPAAEEAVKQLADVELSDWLEERAAMWFGQPSEFDGLPDVERASNDVLAELEKLLEQDRWWEIPESLAAAAQVALQLAYGEGATDAAEIAQELLYTEGKTDSPNLIGLNFNLKNPETIAQLERSAARLVRRVNDGTKFYLKRILVAGVEEGLASPSIAEMLRAGVGVEEILKEAGFTEAAIRTIRAQIEGMTDERLNSIVNTEINRAETEGRLGQWDHIGLTRKRWVHTGEWDVCPVCEANIVLGFVPMDYMFDSVFGPATVPGPPAHPQVDHCHIEFDENEVVERAGELNVWMGD
jgi:hypothetical protein